MAKSCSYCSRPFEPTCYWQRFCTPEHQRAFNAQERKTALEMFRAMVAQSVAAVSLTVMPRANG